MAFVAGSALDANDMLRLSSRYHLLGHWCVDLLDNSPQSPKDCYLDLDNAMTMQDNFIGFARRCLKTFRAVVKTGSLIGAVLVVGSISQHAMADSYQNNWGPEVGSQIALLAAKDQNGDVQQLKDLAGSQGVLIFYNRSADW